MECACNYTIQVKVSNMRWPVLDLNNNVQGQTTQLNSVNNVLLTKIPTHSIFGKQINKERQAAEYETYRRCS